MLQPSTGQVLWNRADVYRNARAIRRCLGYLPQQFELYPHHRPEGFLTYLASLKGLGGRAGLGCRETVEWLRETRGWVWDAQVSLPELDRLRDDPRVSRVVVLGRSAKVRIVVDPRGRPGWVRADAPGCTPGDSTSCIPPELPDCVPAEPTLEDAYLLVMNRERTKA